MESLRRLALLSVAKQGVAFHPALPVEVANELLHAWMEQGGANVAALPSMELPSNVTVVRVAFQENMPRAAPCLEELLMSAPKRDCASRGYAFNSALFRDALRGFAHLRALDVSGTMVRDAAFEGFAVSVPLMQTVAIEGCVKLGDVALWNILQCPRLASLEAKKISGWTNDGFTRACVEAQCKQSLVRLAISQAGKLRDGAIVAMADAFQNSMYSLTVEKCFNVTDECLAGVGKMCKLQSLDLSSCCKITGAGLAHLSNLESLFDFVAEFADNMDTCTALSVAPCVLRSLQVAFCRAFTPEALRDISTSFHALRRLRVQNGDPTLQIEDDFLVQLSRTCGPSLEELQLHPCCVSDVGLGALGTHAKRLQVVHLSGARLMIGNESLALLARECPLVRSVSMGRIMGNATDDTVVNLARSLTDLEMLDLNFHTLSTEGLIEASRFFARLKVLSLRHCTNITNEAIAVLVQRARELTTLDIGKCTRLNLDAVEQACLNGRRLQFLNVSEIGIEWRSLVELRARFPHITIV